MALALWELTETSSGDCLERLVVISDAGEAERSLLGGVVSRVRLFTQVADHVPGVAPDIRALLECAAMSSLGQLALLGTGLMRRSLFALWHDHNLQELDSRSFTESLTQWLRQPCEVEGYVLVELISMSQSSISPIEDSFGSLKIRLRDVIASHIRYRSSAGGEHLTAGAAIGAAQASLSTLAPGEQILLDAAVCREVLAAEWLSATQVNASLGEQLGGGGQRVSKLRRDGQLLGVYVTHPVPSYRYPTWQFRPDGRLVGNLAQILTLLRDSGVFLRESDGLRRTTGWGEVEWFMSPHVLLDGATPAATLIVNPERVLRVAISEFNSGSE